MHCTFPGPLVVDTHKHNLCLSTSPFFVLSALVTLSIRPLSEVGFLGRADKNDVPICTRRVSPI